MMRTTKLLNISAVLAFTLLLTLPEFASANKVCGDIFRTRENELRAVNSPGELQGVRIDLVGRSLHEVYDTVEKQMNWRDLFGKRLLVSYKYSDGVRRRVSQTAYSWDQAVRLYPRLVSIGKPIVEKHHQILSHVEKNWKIRAIGAGMRVFGKGELWANRMRGVPGELGQVVIAIGEEQLSTPILSGFIEGQGEVKGGDPYTSLLVSTKKLREDLPAFVEKSIQAGADRHDLRADVVIFHTHPNVAAPLSREDADVLAYNQRVFAQEFPYISFRFLIVAAAKLETQGDLIFVKEVNVPATAKMK